MARGKLGVLISVLVIAFAGNLLLADASSTTPPSSRPGRGPAWPDADAIVQYIEKLPEKAAGITIISAPVQYGADTVAQWQSAGAEELLKYQYEWSVNAVLAAAGVGDTISVTFHRMSSSVDAYGVFTLRRHGDTVRALTVPTRAYWKSKSLHVWRGPFYVQIEVPADSATPREVVLQLATELMAVVPAPSGLPPFMRLLPMRGRLIGNPVYHAGSVPGYAFEGDAITARYYETQEQQLNHMLIRLGDNTAATSAYNRIVEELAKGVHEVHEMAQIADHAALIISSDEEFWSVVQQGQFVAVTLNGHNEEFVEAMMRMSATNIRIYLLFAR